MSEVIVDWLWRRAADRPDTTAVVAGGAALTYRELDRRVGEVAAGLAQTGVKAGDRIAVLAPNSLEMVELIHALPRVDAVLFPVNLRLTPPEMEWQLRDAGVVRVLAHPAMLPPAKEAASLAGLAEPVALPLRGAATGAAVLSHRSDDPHSIMYTSGTTGRPKGAVLTFGNHLASATGSSFNLGVAEADRWLACLPLFHVGGLSIALRSVIYGTCIVVSDGFEEREVMRSLREDDVTLVSLVPTMLGRLLAWSDERAPEALRVALIGGGPVPLPLLEAALERGYPVIQTYGLTETASQVATLAVDEAVEHAGSAGRPLVTADLAVAAPEGAAGEILIRGAVVSPGYIDGDSVVAARDVEGWFHTGDVGRIDEDGFLYVLDRRDDLIVTGGENVYPAEVEAVLLDHPGVEAVAVVGVPDREWGHVVAAAVVSEGGLEEAVMASWARERLAGYKVPRRWLQVAALPETASGKVRRHAVRELFG